MAILPEVGMPSSCLHVEFLVIEIPFTSVVLEVLGECLLLGVTISILRTEVCGSWRRLEVSAT